jgi:hypothetical protein
MKLSHAIPLGFAALAFSCGALAAEYTLNFNDGAACSTIKPACGNYGGISQSYGDVAGIVNMSYESVDSGGTSLLYFGSGYSELQGVVFALGSATNSHGRITLNAAPGQTISLLGFDLGAWRYPSDTSRFTTLSVKNGNSSQDYAQALEVSTTTSSHIGTTYFGAAGAGQTVTLEWKNDAFNVGLDNLHFSVTQVPEPETYALLLAGLGLLGAATRKKRHTA